MNSMGANLKIDYDEEGDVLYVFSGKPHDTLNFQLDHDLTLRLNDARDVVGIMFHNFSKFFPKAKDPREYRKIGAISLWGAQNAVARIKHDVLMKSIHVTPKDEKQVAQQCQKLFSPKKLGQVLERV